MFPTGENFYASLNSAVFSDGSFCYVPKEVKYPMELSSYFRINTARTGAVRAHAHDRRRKAPSSATWRAAPRRCATRTSCMPPWWRSSWRRTPFIVKSHFYHVHYLISCFSYIRNNPILLNYFTRKMSEALFQ